uniref:Ig-like domain-containing protein n=1 Tax=Kryptolebias marmoratus TaxID=37003 RepID=A0A3Q3AG05_KRYMA
MIAGLAALTLLSTLSTIQAAEVSDPIALTVVDLGGKVTLKCNVYEKDLKFFHWFKQPLGQMVETVASMILGRETTGEKFKGSRFRATTDGTQYFLTISNISKEDEATYLCLTGTTYSQKFINATYLVVNGKIIFFSSVLKLSHLVQQGDLVTLMCSIPSKSKENKVLCQAEHSVYWFRTKSEGFHPGIIHIQRNISNKDVERSCSYSLSVRDSYDDGTYCAVVTCGAILFSEGTNMKTNLLVVILGGLLACCLIVIVLLIFYIKQKTDCQHSKGRFPSSKYILCIFSLLLSIT